MIHVPKKRKIAGVGRWERIFDDYYYKGTKWAEKVEIGESKGSKIAIITTATINKALKTSLSFVILIIIN